ncbi:MAG: hypothetical protein ACI9DH_001423 [Halioglobus sp.]|jgi:hypothetical protein
MYQKLLIAIDPEDDGEGKRALEAAMDLLAEDDGRKRPLTSRTTIMVLMQKVQRGVLTSHNESYNGLVHPTLL